MVNIDEFIEIRDCIYKDEHYSVRDNGAIMRHQRNGLPTRKLDEVWTFGNPDLSTGYMVFCGERVHRIVATAFHGEAPSNQHVVDHIDTNRRNNRPENLRWLTKLENILNNEITRKKVELICGSVEAFLENPSLLFGYETEDPNFSWMRTVSPEEARVSRERLTNWAKEHTKPQGGSLGEWIYQKRKPISRVYTPMSYQQSKIVESDPVHAPQETKSLTPNAIQLDWKHPVEFPCCPQQATDKPLET